MTSINAALNNYARRLSSKDQNRAKYLSRVRRFLEYSEGDLSREAVESFMAVLEKEDKRPTTRRQYFSLIRSLFMRNNIEWPFNRGEGPQVGDRDVQKPALDPSIIAEMIHAAKSGKLDAEKTAYLAVSTTYGTRQIELRELNDTGKDIEGRPVEFSVDIGGRTIYIATAKSGWQRYHVLPDELVPYLENHRFRPHTEAEFRSLWYFLEDAIKFPHYDRVGFHSVRRTLDTELLKVLPVETVRSFLRWKKATSRDMAFRYSATTYLGRETKTQEMAGDLKQEDIRVFRVHPFLRYWKEGA